MPIARFQMPDGRIGRFEVPEGTTPEQAQTMIQQQISSQSVEPPAQPSQLVPKQTALERFGRGLRDPIDAAAQLLTNALPTSVVQAGNRLNNLIAEKTGLVGRLPEGGVDQQVREAEQQYQRDRAASGQSGMDWSRMAGNVLNPANLAMASRIPQAATLAGRIGLGAATGAGFGTLTPVGQGDFWQEKQKQAGAGLVGGALVPAVTGGIARVISPNAASNPNLSLLQAEGVQPTVGQTLGGRWNALEEKLQSVPIVGDAIANARGRALEQFNRAAINRASGKIGENVSDIGQSGVKQAGDALSKAYEDTLSQVKFIQFDPQFQAQLTQLQGMAGSLVPSMRAKFQKVLADVVMGRRSPNGAMLGETYKTVDSELGNLAARYGKSSVASEQELGDAVKQLQALMNEQMRRSNPQVADKLAEIDAGWANLVRVEGAAKAAKNAEGVFTPAQLNTAIQGADSSVRKRAVSRGTALMQGLGNAGQSVLGNKVPNSFTTDRALIAGGALGSYFVNPAIPAGLVGGAALYAPPVQNALRFMLTQRPEVANALASYTRQAAPMLTPVGAQFGIGASQ